MHFTIILLRSPFSTTSKLRGHQIVSHSCHKTYIQIINKRGILTIPGPSVHGPPSNAMILAPVPSMPAQSNPAAMLRATPGHRIAQFPASIGHWLGCNSSNTSICILALLVLFCLTLVSNRINRKRGISHPVSLGIGSTEPIHECLNREANLSPLGSALGLQCL